MRVFECLLVHFDVCWCASSERTMIECNKKQSVKGLAIIKNKIEQDIETQTLFRVYQSTNQPTQTPRTFNLPIFPGTIFIV